MAQRPHNFFFIYPLQQTTPVFTTKKKKRGHRTHINALLPFFFFSIATMPRTRRRFRPARARLRLHTFIQTKCFICLDSPGEYPSWKLPCCRRFIHEACLL